jgi:hypothetical protein
VDKEPEAGGDEAAPGHTAAIQAAVDRLAARVAVGDLDGFMKEIAGASVGDRRQLGAWFRGYTTAGLVAADWQIESTGRDGDHLTALVGVWLRFRDYDPINEVFKFWFRPEGDLGWIVGFEQTRRLGVCAGPGGSPGASVAAPATAPLWPIVSVGDFEGELEALLPLARAIPDPESAENYAHFASPGMGRMESSLVRRMAHSAASLMSGTTATVAAAVSRATVREAALAVHSLIQGLVLGYPQEVLQATVASRNLPWLMSDEMAGFLPMTGKVYSGTCQGLAELVSQSLRLCGAGPTESLMVELHLHDAALYAGGSPAEPALLFSNQALVVCGPRSVHWNRSIGGFWNDHAGWHSDGEIIDPAGAAAAFSRLSARTPFLAVAGGWPSGLPKTATGGGDGTERAFAPAGSGPARLSLGAKTTIFGLAAANPSSHYAGARYTLQTLLVRRPEAYLLRGMGTEAVRLAGRTYSTTDSFLDFLAAEIKDGSIFPETHRIMTGDQVFRYRRADAKGRALLVATYLACRDQPAAIAWTDDGWYVLTREKGETLVFRAATMDRTPRVTGKLRLLLGKSGSFYPLLGGDGSGPGIYGDAGELIGFWAGVLEGGAPGRSSRP